MTPWTIHEGDAFTVLRTLPDASVQCCVTSPPYWGLRDYGVAGQLGLEATPDDYVAAMVDVFREVRRVLRDDGTLWLNLGDSYASGEIGRHDNGSTFGDKYDRKSFGPRQQQRLRSGLKPKDLCGIPCRVAFALQADGWWLRSDIIWSKPNPMPESITDRPTKAHEYVFLLTKSERYFFDQEAVREPVLTQWSERDRTDTKHSAEGFRPAGHPREDDGRGRNVRSVWTIATNPFPEAHFATFPTKLVEPCIKAGSSERGGCPQCGAGWERIVEREGSDSVRGPKSTQKVAQGLATAFSGYADGSSAPKFTTLGWRPTCKCRLPNTIDAVPWTPQPCVVLDPFSGAGTTGLVANRLGRAFVGIELNPTYATMARRRIVDDAPLLNAGASA